MKRLRDQVLILEAIGQVKRELEDKKAESWIVTGEVMVRLATLYSLLDVTRLKAIVETIDKRTESNNERKVA